MKLTKRQLKRIIREERELLMAESRLPEVPGTHHSTDLLHFWRSLASMAKNNPNLLIKLLIEKGEADQRASDARWQDSMRDAYNDYGPDDHNY